MPPFTDLFSDKAEVGDDDLSNEPEVAYNWLSLDLSQRGTALDILIGKSRPVERLILLVKGYRGTLSAETLASASVN